MDMPWLTAIEHYLAALYDEYQEKKFKLRLAGAKI